MCSRAFLRVGHTKASSVGKCSNWSEVSRPAARGLERIARGTRWPRALRQTAPGDASDGSDHGKSGEVLQIQTSTTLQALPNFLYRLLEVRNSGGAQGLDEFGPAHARDLCSLPLGRYGQP
jgi:hypothetical protein